MDTAHEQLVNRLAHRYRDALGADAGAYLGHLRRVLTFYELLQGRGPDEREVIAGFFHDIGLFTDRTADYIEPSEREARRYLEEIGHREWFDRIAAMIANHHKLTPYRGPDANAAEAFRQADLIDVTAGLYTGGLERTTIRRVFLAEPPGEFRRFLARKSIKWLLTRPANPFPMFRF